jgi:hypothetical protein
MRLGERGFGSLAVADRDIEQHVAGLIRPHLGRALLHRVDDADHRRQRRPFDRDGLDRVTRQIDGLSDNERNSIADMAHLALGEDRIWRAGERIDFEVKQTRKTAEILDVIGGQDQSHARQAPRARRIDGEFRAGMRRAQHQRMHRG